MNKRFKRKLKLRKNVVLFNKIFLILLLMIYMQNSKYLKHFLKTDVHKFIKSNYIESSNNLSMVVSNNDKTNNEIFEVKESKDSNPLIYIYNTHQTEKYLDTNNLYKPNVLYAARYLNEKFNDSGLISIVENRNVNEVLNKNGWSYGSSYKVSRYFIEDTCNTYSSIKYLFDIHRDAGSHEYTTLCVDDTCYAKLLFIIGLENENYNENQMYAEQISKRVNNKVNGLSKGILQKQGKKVNGVYNQDYSPRTILIEVGGENNTMDEVYNTLNILSEVLIDYIKEENNNGR